MNREILDYIPVIGSIRTAKRSFQQEEKIKSRNGLTRGGAVVLGGTATAALACGGIVERIVDPLSQIEEDKDNIIIPDGPPKPPPGVWDGEVKAGSSTGGEVFTGASGDETSSGTEHGSILIDPADDVQTKFKVGDIDCEEYNPSSRVAGIKCEKGGRVLTDDEIAQELRIQETQVTDVRGSDVRNQISQLIIDFPK